MNKRFITFTFISILFVSCSGKYCFIDDKNIIPNKNVLDQFDEFQLTIFYNDLLGYRDTPLSVYEIRDGYCDKQITVTFYRHVFIEFFSNFFPKRITVQKNTNKSSVYINTLCEVTNPNKEVVLWYSYESESEEFMVLNGKIFKRNEMLMNFTKSLIEHSEVVVP